MSSCKLVDTLASTTKIGLQPSDLYSDPTCYRQIIGALQYLTFTRPNICYAANKVCQFMHFPTESHWAAEMKRFTIIKRILRYLKGTSSFGLHLTRGSSLSLHGFTDVDWVGSIDDRKSTGSYIVFLGSTPISWKSGKQCTVYYVLRYTVTIVCYPNHINIRDGYFIGKPPKLIVNLVSTDQK